VVNCVGYNKLLFHEHYTALRDWSRRSLFTAQKELNFQILFKLNSFFNVLKYLHSTKEIIYRRDRGTSEQNLVNIFSSP
jgi:hypothetical protein